VEKIGRNRCATGLISQVAQIFGNGTDLEIFPFVLLQEGLQMADQEFQVCARVAQGFAMI
jgi:hypothetical protein